MKGLASPLMSGITYAFVQPFVSQFLTKFNIGVQDEMAQIIAAIVLKNVVKNQIISNYANAAIIVNTASLARGLSGNLFSGNLFSPTNGGSVTTSATMIG